MKVARMEPLASVVRVWNDETQGYGDPYEWVASVRWLAADQVEILGYTKPVTPSIWRALRRECQRLKVRRVLAVNYRNGKRRERWIGIPDPVQQFYR